MAGGRNEQERPATASGNKHKVKCPHGRNSMLRLGSWTDVSIALDFFVLRAAVLGILYLEHYSDVTEKSFRRRVNASYDGCYPSSAIVCKPCLQGIE